MIKLNQYLKTDEEIEVYIEKAKLIKETKEVSLFLKVESYYDFFKRLNIEKQILNTIDNYSNTNFHYENNYEISKKQIELIANDMFDNISCLKKYNCNREILANDLNNLTVKLKQNEIPTTKKDITFLENEIFRLYSCELKINMVFNQRDINLNQYIKSKSDIEIAKVSKTSSIQEKKIVDIPVKIDSTPVNQWGKCKFRNEKYTPISQLSDQDEVLSIRGEITKFDMRSIRNGKSIVIIDITDRDEGITVKCFIKEKEREAFFKDLKVGLFIGVNGKVEYDSYSRCNIFKARSICKLNRVERMDEALEKRVELHAHTKMSDMDGLVSAKDLVNTAIRWGHKAIGITDHGIVQAFPEAMETARKHDLKVLYGMEGYLHEKVETVWGNTDASLDDSFVVFDIETTGLSAYYRKITEIGAVKIKNRKIIDRYNVLIDPKEKLPTEIIELTGITDEMLEGQKTIDEVMPEFISFCGDCPLVAHNAKFDMAFIKREVPTLNNAVIDTLPLSRMLVTEIKRHKLDKLTKFFNVRLDSHHRAVDDAEATANVFIHLLNRLEKQNILYFKDVNKHISETIHKRFGETFHIIIYAKNYTGLKNLYYLVSESHIDNFYKKPLIYRKMLDKYREGLIIGSACEAGEVFKKILKAENKDNILKTMEYYDYLEIQPIANNMHLVRNQAVRNTQDLEDINRKIYNYANKLGKLTVATGDVHFLNKEDEIYRRIIMAGKGFQDADEQAPLYLKTTNEMLNDFNYFDKNIQKEIVIENPNKIADMIEKMKPIPDETFPPKIEGSEEELRQITEDFAKELYGPNLPEEVSSRLNKELNSIISNGYAVLYIIAQKLVKKSMEDGYLVGSRGSVGSSFAATMSGITEVNPLQPHYLCKKCFYCEFIKDGSYGSGVDMPDKICPKCGEKLNKEGFDIPFEVFLGFEGDKEPDIDLNFASEEQSVAHQYTEELFGEGYVFRAGTIGTIAEKTAFGFVKKYLESKEIEKHGAEIQRLTVGCSGVKRTSGQHPGGVMVVPSDKDIHDFSPIQYPANDSTTGVKTTHFDYHSISGRILKLDILGHDTPTIIKMLEGFTDTNAQEVALDDKETMKLFLSTEPLGITPEDLGITVGTLGIPEFGTPFVRQMLVDTMPTTFSELVRISGLSHGTDVWVNNAQDLVRDGVTTLKTVISTRDDIMTYLIYAGLEKKMSFTIMESVRKGKGLKPEHEEAMVANNVPTWYIDSCKKIKYMFPKAHAVAYVMMSFRIAYYKVHYPAAFYATYFTMKANDFDGDLICKGRSEILKRIDELSKLGNDKTAKDKNLLTVLEVSNEMYAREVILEKVDLYNSDDKIFIAKDNKILPPLIALQGVGESVAANIVEARGKGEFISIEDLTKRTKANKTCIEALKNHGCLKGMSATNQLNLFDI
jgi:DNA polymerase-3 subunit alpha (Gram-positive type)